MTTNSWNSTNPAGVVSGGTGLATLTTAYGVVCAGTTATGILQNAGAGTSGQILTSNGAAALPSFKTPTGSISAWAKWDQTAATTLANTSTAGLSSLVASATGTVTLNFTSAFSNANYAIAGISIRGVITGTCTINVSNVTPPTTTALVILTEENGANQNYNNNSILVIGT